jgi:hypothetical protein
VLAAQASSTIAIAMVVALVAFGAGLPVLIHDSRRPRPRREPKPILVREPRPVKPSRRIVLPLLGPPLPPLHASGRPVGTGSGAPLPSHVATRRVVIAIATFVLLSIWSTRAARPRSAARR